MATVALFKWTSLTPEERRDLTGWKNKLSEAAAMAALKQGKFDVVEVEAATPEQAFAKLNDRPGLPHRSMSVGDVVLIEGAAFQCAPFGWAEIMDATPVVKALGA